MEATDAMSREKEDIIITTFTEMGNRPSFCSASRVDEELLHKHRVRKKLAKREEVCQLSRSNSRLSFAPLVAEEIYLFCKSRSEVSMENAGDATFVNFSDPQNRKLEMCLEQILQEQFGFDPLRSRIATSKEGIDHFFAVQTEDELSRLAFIEEDWKKREFVLMRFGLHAIYFNETPSKQYWLLAKWRIARRIPKAIRSLYYTAPPTTEHPVLIFEPQEGVILAGPFIRDRKWRITLENPSTSVVNFRVQLGRLPLPANLYPSHGVLLQRSKKAVVMHVPPAVVDSLDGLARGKYYLTLDEHYSGTKQHRRQLINVFILINPEEEYAKMLRDKHDTSACQRHHSAMTYLYVFIITVLVVYLAYIV